MISIERVEGSVAWIRNAGLYQQVDVYRRGDVLFAKVKGGYVRLSVSGGTSHPNIRWIEVDPAGNLMEIRDGHMPTYGDASTKVSKLKKG